MDRPYNYDSRRGSFQQNYASALNRSVSPGSPGSPGSAPRPLARAATMMTFTSTPPAIPPKRPEVAGKLRTMSEAAVPSSTGPPTGPRSRFVIVRSQRNSLADSVRAQTEAAIEARQTVSTLRKLALRMAVKISVKEAQLASHARALARSRKTLYSEHRKHEEQVGKVAMSAEQQAKVLADTLAQMVPSAPSKTYESGNPLSPPPSPGQKPAKPATTPLTPWGHPGRAQPADPFMTAQRHVAIIQQEYQAKQNEVRGLERAENRLRGVISGYEDKFNNINATRARLVQELNVAQGKLARLTEAQSKLKGDHDAEKARADSEKTRADALNDESVAKSRALDDLERTRESLEADQKAALSEVSRLASRVEELESANALVESELQAALQSRASLQDELRRVQAAKQNLERQLRDAVEGRQRAEAEVAIRGTLAQKLEDELSGARHRIAGHEKMRGKYHEAIKKLKAEKGVLEEEVRGIEERLAKSEALGKEVDVQVARLKELNGSMSRDAEQRKTLEKALRRDIAALAEEKAALDADLTAEVSARQASEDALKSSLAAHQASQARLEAELTQLKSVEAGLLADLAKLRDTESTLTADIERRAATEARQAAEISHLSDDRAALEAAARADAETRRVAEVALEREIGTLQAKRAALEAELAAAHEAAAAEAAALKGHAQGLETELAASRAALEAANQAHENELSAIRDMLVTRLNQIKQREDGLERDLATTTSKMHTAEKEAAEARNTLGAVEEEWRKLEDELRGTQMRLSALESLESKLRLDLLLTREREPAIQMELGRTKQLVSQLESDLASANEKLATAQAAVDSLTARLTASELSNAELTKALQAIQTAKERVEAHLGRAQKGKARAEAGLDIAHNRLQAGKVARSQLQAKLARTEKDLALALRRNTELETLLQRAEGDIGEVERRTVDTSGKYDEFVQQSAARLAEAKAEMEGLEAAKRDVEAQLAAHGAELDELRTANSDLLQKLEEADAELAALKDVQRLNEDVGTQYDSATEPSTPEPVTPDMAASFAAELEALRTTKAEFEAVVLSLQAKNAELETLRAHFAAQAASPEPSPARELAPEPDADADAEAEPLAELLAPRTPPSQRMPASLPRTPSGLAAVPESSVLPSPGAPSTLRRSRSDPFLRGRAARLRAELLPEDAVIPRSASRPVHAGRLASAPARPSTSQATPSMQWEWDALYVPEFGAFRTGDSVVYHPARGWSVRPRVVREIPPAGQMLAVRDPVSGQWGWAGVPTLAPTPASPGSAKKGDLRRVLAARSLSRGESEVRPEAPRRRLSRVGSIEGLKNALRPRSRAGSVAEADASADGASPRSKWFRRRSSVVSETGTLRPGTSAGSSPAPSRAPSVALARPQTAVGERPGTEGRTWSSASTMIGGATPGSLGEKEKGPMFVPVVGWGSRRDSVVGTPELDEKLGMERPVVVARPSTSSGFSVQSGESGRKNFKAFWEKVRRKDVGMTAHGQPAPLVQ